MKTTLFILLLLGSFNLFCKPILKIDSIETTVVLNNTYSNDYFVQKTITIMHKKDATNFFVVASAGNSGNVNNRIMTKTSSGGNLDEISYQIINNLSDEYIVKDLANAIVLSDVLSGYFAQSNSNQYQTLSFYYTIPASQFVRSGLYSDSVKFELYEGDLSSNKRSAFSTVQLSSNEAVVADVAVVNRGGTFDSASISKTLDFGILEGGDSDFCDIISRTNSDGGYSIAIVSGNSGTLAHISDLSQLISYSLSVDGISADLILGFSDTKVSLPEPLIPENRYELDFLVVDPLPEVSSGDYRDVLTITLTALF